MAKQFCPKCVSMVDIDTDELSNHCPYCGDDTRTPRNGDEKRIQRRLEATYPELMAWKKSLKCITAAELEADGV